jgi:hypothetical protein
MKVAPRVGYPNVETCLPHAEFLVSPGTYPPGSQRPEEA